MTKLSANTLIHLTPKLSYLQNIIINGFYPRYCHEKYGITDTVIDIWQPMVCFCDIPLAQLKNHINIYGNYGICLTKEWANRKELSPILYIRKNSFIAKQFKTIQNALRDNKIGNKDAQYAILYLLRHMKPYEGKSLSGKEKVIRFYDEREWRYTPNYSKDIPFALTEIELNSRYNIKEVNKELEKFHLDFELQDIKFLIVKDKSQIPLLIKSIEKKYNLTNEVQFQIPTIITTSQIFEDF